MDPSVNNSEDTPETPADLKQTVAVEWDWFFVMQLILAIVGIVGNVLVIAVYLAKLRVKSSSNKLIAVLAVADLLTSIANIPHPFLAYVPQTVAGRAYCKLVHSRVVMWISIVASIFTLTLLSLERFFAVVHPVRHRSVFSKSNMKYFIAAVWGCALIPNTISFYVPEVSKNNNCVLVWPSATYQAANGVVLFVFEFVLPVIVMVACHYFAVKELKKQAKALLERNQSTNSPAFSLLRSRRRVIVMVLVVVITFIICWAPDQIGFLILNLGGLSPAYFTSLTYRALTILAFLNSCANPLIYIGLNKNFRAAVSQLFCSKLKIGVAFRETPAGINLANSGQENSATGRSVRTISTRVALAPKERKGNCSTDFSD